MKRIFKILTTALFICSVWILGGIEEVRAEEYIVRDGTGSLEELVGIEIPEDQAEQWIEDGKTWDQQTSSSWL